MTPSPATAPQVSCPPAENDSSLMPHLSLFSPTALLWGFPVIKELVRALQHRLGGAADVTVDQAQGLVGLACKRGVEDGLVLAALVALGAPVERRQAAI